MFNINICENLSSQIWSSYVYSRGGQGSFKSDENLLVSLMPFLNHACVRVLHTLLKMVVLMMGNICGQ